MRNSRKGAASPSITNEFAFARHRQYFTFQISNSRGFLRLDYANAAFFAALHPQTEMAGATSLIHTMLLVEEAPASTENKASNSDKKEVMLMPEVGLACTWLAVFTGILYYALGFIWVRLSRLKRCLLRTGPSPEHVKMTKAIILLRAPAAPHVHPRCPEAATHTYPLCPSPPPPPPLTLCMYTCRRCP